MESGGQGYFLFKGRGLRQKRVAGKLQKMWARPKRIYEKLKGVYDS